MIAPAYSIFGGILYTILTCSCNVWSCPQDDSLSPSEESLVPFMALEVAAILDDLDLAELLLENGASVSVCFAVHLAALKGGYCAQGYLTFPPLSSMK